MKKQYIAPMMHTEEIEPATIIAASPGFSSLSDGPTKGGDATGMEADGKERDSWDEGLW